MTRAALLDVNVLVALAWPNHVHHRRARTWFADRRGSAWATTPITELGLVRVSTNRAALPSVTTPKSARQLLATLRRVEGHRFLADDVELVVSDTELTAGSHREVTDAHLLALAARHDASLVTFDRGIRRLLGEFPAEVLTLLEA